MNNKLNKDVDTRDRIVFGIKYNPEAYMGGIRRFKNLTYEELVKLRDCNFLDPYDAQNYAPTIEEIMEFMKNHSGFTAHGYVVSPERSNYRLSIEGVEKEGNITNSDKGAFIELFGDADELTMDDNWLYCWFD